MTDEHIEVVKISDWKPVRARKTHTCTYCNHDITPGSVYFRQAWKVEGEIIITKSHGPYGECAAEEPALTTSDEWELRNALGEIR